MLVFAQTVSCQDFIYCTVSGSAGRMIFVRSGRETSTGSKHCYPGQGKGFSPYFTGLYTFSHLFVRHVFNVGHPAEAELYAARDEGEQFSEQFSNYIIKKTIL